MSEHITVYAVFGDMENDIPDAYVLTEAAAKHLLQDTLTGDFIAMDITLEEWMNLLIPKVSKS
jgi:hypothetical protein